MDKSNTNNNTITKNEYLSAFLDDAAGDFERRRTLDELQKDDELLKKVASYSLIGEAMRNENAHVTVRTDFLAGIHEQIAEAPTFSEVKVSVQEDVQGSVPVKSASNDASWLKPLTGMALAASLAAVAVMGFNSGGLTIGTSPEPAVGMTSLSNEVKTPLPAPTVAEEALTQVAVLNSPDAAWRIRLKGYVNNHARYASTAAIMPSVRAVSYASTY